MVFAPASGEMAIKPARRRIAQKIQPSPLVKLVATKPGWRRFAVTPEPSSRRANSRVKRMLASLEWL